MIFIMFGRTEKAPFRKSSDLIIRTKSLKNMSPPSFPQNILVYGSSFICLVQAPEPLPTQCDMEHVLFSLGSWLL